MRLQSRTKLNAAHLSSELLRTAGDAHRHGQAQPGADPDGHADGGLAAHAPRHYSAPHTLTVWAIHPWPISLSTSHTSWKWSGTSTPQHEVHDPYAAWPYEGLYACALHNPSPGVTAQRISSPHRHHRLQHRAARQLKQAVPTTSSPCRCRQRLHRQPEQARPLLPRAHGSFPRSPAWPTHEPSSQPSLLFP